MHFCDSKRLIEFDNQIRYMYHCFFLHLDVNLWCKCTYEIAFIFFTFPDSLEKMRHDLRDRTEKIEIEMKKIKEELSRLTATVEKSTDEGWLLERGTHK